MYYYCSWSNIRHYLNRKYVKQLNAEREKIVQKERFDRAVDREYKQLVREYESIVETINDYSYSWCTGLRSIVIPEGVTSIGNGAFMLCEGLTNVKIPNSVINIGAHAFEDCTNLNYVDVPNRNAVIDESAFNFNTVERFLRSKYGF